MLILFFDDFLQYFTYAELCYSNYFILHISYYIVLICKYGFCTIFMNVIHCLRGHRLQSSYLYENLPVQTKMSILSRRRILLAILLSEQFLHLTQINLHPNIQFLSTQQNAYQSFLVTSWFDSVCVTVACWANFKEKHSH